VGAGGLTTANESVAGVAKHTTRRRNVKKSMPKSAHNLPFAVGETILIRTVTMIQLGRVVSITDDSFVLEDGGWVADTGRFGAMLEQGTLNEFEKAPSWILVARGAIVDVYPWTHPLPAKTL
jgi:hypothetical protein